MPRKTYTRGFKLPALKMMTDQGLSAAEVARRLGVTEGGLRTWKPAAEEHGEAAFPGHGNPAPAEDELRRRRAENARLRAERGLPKRPPQGRSEALPPVGSGRVVRQGQRTPPSDAGRALGPRVRADPGGVARPSDGRFQPKDGATARTFRRAKGAVELAVDAGKVNTREHGWKDLKIAVVSKREPGEGVTPDQWQEDRLPGAGAVVSWVTIAASKVFRKSWGPSLRRLGVTEGPGCRRWVTVPVGSGNR